MLVRQVELVEDLDDLLARERRVVDEEDRPRVLRRDRRDPLSFPIGGADVPVNNLQKCPNAGE